MKKVILFLLLFGALSASAQTWRIEKQVIINQATKESSMSFTDVFIHLINDKYYFSNHEDTKREKYEVLGQEFVRKEADCICFKWDGYLVKFYFK